MRRFNFKHIAMAAVAILVAAGMVAFKHVKESGSAQSTQWYEVTITGSPASDPGNQLIESTRSAPPQGPDPTNCAISNPGNPCAVLLEFDSSVDPGDLVGLTVQQAEDDHDATANDYGEEPEP